MGNWYQDEQD